MEYKDLNLSDEQTQQVKGLIEGTINPSFYTDVRSWISQCYHKPKDESLIMCALNQVMEGYGVEDIRGEWRNGYCGDIVAEYVNMGDAYAPTVVYHRDEGFMIASYGDAVESIDLLED